MAKPRVTIYSTTSCAYCQAERSFLRQHGIEFTEIMVDSDEGAAGKMIELSGQMGVPFTVVETEDKPEYVLGFDQPRLTSVLGL